ncbi:MAG: ribonuclease III [Alphaproteobacteria bacterium]|nr:ribonuclease III [Alphaproteobacteria bacterium]
MSGELSELEARIGYRFRDRTLLEEALTHPSIEANQREGGDYDRLEFLGDRVIGLVVATELWRRHEDARAGELALRYNAIVRRESLAEAAARIGLGEHVRLSRAERGAGGAEKPAVLADALEALVGAIYIDGGLEQAHRLVAELVGAQLASTGGGRKDAKTALQELTHAQGFAMPSYSTLRQTGPAHEPCFQVRVEVEGQGAAEGSGRSKREAEQAAALALLGRLRGEAP